MTDKHTPGPWKAGAFGSVGPNTLDKPVAFTQRHTPDGLPYMTAEEEAANAHLIAAAPELLEALERLIPTLSVDCDCEENEAGDIEGDCAFCQARAAIKTTKGDA